jgi:predicted permease
MLFLIALMIQTAVYCVAVYQSIQDYEAWTKADQEWINRMLSENLPPPEIRQVFINYAPYILSLQGKLALSFGVALASSWIILGVGSLLNDRKKTSQT